ncbi:MAG: hypothetical protein CMI13_16715 [Oleibacter sp.]|nr:hypothetical protein [Thalassolituus sp.]|tara:strand:+ start:136 stop:405 length:270 start_codon:yes stop_codon:yes gene_type:complete
MILSPAIKSTAHKTLQTISESLQIFFEQYKRSDMHHIWANVKISAKNRTITKHNLLNNKTLFRPKEKDNLLMQCRVLTLFLSFLNLLNN